MRTLRAERYVQLLLSFAWRVETVFLPALNWTVTVPLQPSARVTGAGSRSRPDVVNRYSGLLVTARLDRGGVRRVARNRGTTTVRPANALCCVVSTATTASVLRLTSSPRGW